MIKVQLRDEKIMEFDAPVEAKEVAKKISMGL